MTRVALLWHMHQPFYEDLATGDHVLPWVRFHAMKDYWGMVALLREFPTVKATFNLVPSLLVQLESFAGERARDRHLELSLKPAEALSDDERAFCIKEFFHAHRPRMIDPYPRYAELLARREQSNGVGLSVRSQVSHFSIEDIRDLQVWHKLAWIDPYYFERDERIGALVAKGRRFTEEDKMTLRAVELELLRRVIPEYRDAAARGQIEISTSPFYHPILPLLCDTDVYLRTHPSSRMPRERFRHPEDASQQLSNAVALHERLFGRQPIGLWPSEGSVSDAMVPLVAAAGFQWMATDEEILGKSIAREFTRDRDGNVENPEALYRSYRVGRDAQVSCGFRDHTLSDLIGFTYASWNPEAAADNFVQRLADAGARYAARTNGGEATIFVILDGENAWEHYEGQGRPFLRALYKRLGTHASLKTVTMAEACAAPKDTLPSIFPGSWINADFYIWIGHPDDQRAWSQLADARRTLESAAGVAPEALARAWEELLIAEGSDWFWWYGDDHSSDHDLVFDELFRRHVRNIYRAIDVPAPEELFVSNITTRPPATDIVAPSGFIHPVIDGEITSYFEWIGAGSVDVAPVGDAMHEVSARDAIVSAIDFGFDLTNLYVKVAGAAPMRDVIRGDQQLSVNFLRPEGCRIVVSGADGTVRAQMVDRPRGLANGASRSCPDIKVAIGQVLELQVPFHCLGVTKESTVAFLVAVNRNAAEVEHHPRHQPIEVQVPDERFPSRNWTA